MASERLPSLELRHAPSEYLPGANQGREDLLPERALVSVAIRRVVLEGSELFILALRVGGEQRGEELRLLVLDLCSCPLFFLPL
mmetsp:Transcript_19743/g.18800  ORF Transcript_19743/g.18800 Transcript_19743/m.18800 type:complete len:84 (-) Transcript_19743:649-900(-)